MSYSKTWQEHLEEVFKWLEAADFKIKCSNCEFIKTKVHYLGFLAGVNGIQPLPEKFAMIQALEPARDNNELRQFLGLKNVSLSLQILQHV